MTTPSERVEVLKADMLRPGHLSCSSCREGVEFLFAHLDALQHTLTLWDKECGGRSPRELREALAGAHAIRCTCDGATRDARCAELQGVAGSTPAEPGPDPLGGFRLGLQR